MSTFLISTTEVHRADTENEAANLINEAKTSSDFQLSKYNSEYKETKMKGEVVDSYYKISLTKTFTDIKEPTIQTSVTYGVE